MKKKNLLKTLLLSLFLILFFSACEKKFPDPEKDPVIIEVIEQNYLVLKPSVLTKLSYENPKNIFLEESKGGDGRVLYSWYKKIAGTYELVSLKNKPLRYLESDLAYEIIDTLSVSEITWQHLQGERFLMEKTYQEGSSIIKQFQKKEILSQYFWLKTKFITQDFLLNYDPKTKSFFTSNGKTVSEIKTDLGPVMLVLLFLFFAVMIILRDKIKRLKTSREKIFNNFIENGPPTIENDHQLNSWILFLLISTFNSFYFCFWEGFNYGATILIALLSGIVAIIIHWPNVLIRDNNYFKFTKLSTIFIISVILFLELILMNVPKVFGLVSSAAVFSLAIINLLLELKFYYQSKKSISNKNYRN